MRFRKLTLKLLGWAGGIGVVGAGVVAAGAERGLRAIDTFKYPTSRAAQAAWQPMSGSAEVTLTNLAGLPALRMPCAFRGATNERASWDRTLSLDLRDSQEIQFKFFCADPAPVDYFSIYFQSGQGWYAATFSPSTTQRWETITIRKDEARTEGRPAGWGKIRAVRVSAWRALDRDTEFVLADWVAIPDRSEIVVVRSDSAVKLPPAEIRAMNQQSQAMVEHFKALGLKAVEASDLDLSAPRLKGKRLVVLPNNPVLSEPAIDALVAYLKQGGKLLAFYTLPVKLAANTGIEIRGHIRPNQPDQFATIRFATRGPAAIPQEITQHSWNIVEARPVKGRSKTLAYWYSQDGQNTQYPAVLASTNCVFMTHILLPEDLARKRTMLLSLAARLVPAFWPQTTKAMIQQMGQFGSFRSFETASEEIVRLADQRAEPVAALKQARAMRELAIKKQSQRQWMEAAAAAREARHFLIEAWARVQTSEAKEQRAFWCHSAFGPSGLGWDESARLLAENGFTAVLPNLLWGGVAFYESHVLPMAPEVKTRGDQLVQCLAACRKYGLQCHVWKVCWNLGSATPRSFAERMKQEGRMQVKYDGTANDSWLCPSHPLNQQLEIDAMIEVATQYDVDGVHFDYIRYPDRDGCFCAGCRERFEKVAGTRVGHWPADVRNEKTLATQWLDFRRDNITRVVAGVSEAIRTKKPQVKVSAAVFRNWPADRDSVGQDWKLWCDRGYLDFVCPMDYTASALEFGNSVAQQQRWAGRVACYPGIGLSVWPTPADIPRLIEQIRACRNLGTRGFTVFDYRALEAREVLPWCGMGITRREP